MSKFGGYTNKDKKIENGIFSFTKTYKKNNHRLDYMVLKEFGFAPEIIFDDSTRQERVAIETGVISDWEDFSRQVIENMLAVHNSKIKLPSWEKAHSLEEFKRIDDRNKYGKLVLKTKDRALKAHEFLNNNQICNIHGDLAAQNILCDANGKAWFIDWEMASHGHPAFDLAYFFKDYKLPDKEEKRLLALYVSNGGMAIDYSLIKEVMWYIRWVSLIHVLLNPELFEEHLLDVFFTKVAIDSDTPIIW